MNQEPGGNDVSGSDAINLPALSIPQRTRSSEYPSHTWVEYAMHHPSLIPRVSQPNSGVRNPVCRSSTNRSIFAELCEAKARCCMSASKSRKSSNGGKIQRQVPSYKVTVTRVRNCCDSPNPPVSGWALSPSDVRVQPGCALGHPIKLRGISKQRRSRRFSCRVSFPPPACRPLRVALAVSASRSRSGPNQAPAGWKSGAERGADIHVVVEVPDPCLASDGIVN